MLGIARGVKYMHKFHIRHGDLKLENVIICHVNIFLFRAFQKSPILTASTKVHLVILPKREERVSFGEALSISVPK
jgi:hypothetical protein